MGRAAGFVGAVLLLAFLMAGCDSTAPSGRVPDPGPDESALAQSNNAFALDLYAKLREQKGNLFLSPYSISSALAMTYAGARGQTAAQMAKALHFDLAPDRLHAAFSDLRAALDATGKLAGCELAVANALWAQKDYPFLKGFLDLARTSYGAGTREVDFANAAEAARQTINRWTAEQTRDRIQDLIPPGELDALTRLVLTNAIYFKGIWDSKFPARGTQDAPFTLLTGEKVEVPMMHQTGRFEYDQADGVQVLGLPYKGTSLSMVILLPAKTDGLAGIEAALRENKLLAWIGSPKHQEVRVFIPRFKLTASFSLNDALKSLGMTNAFGQGAVDFSGMSGKADLFISAVLHKAHVEVNEKGTEAAAATVVKISVGTEMHGTREGPVEFRADHPFLFLIRHNRSGSILFLGRVMNPKE